MSGGVQKRWLSVKSRIIRSYFEKSQDPGKNPKKLKKELSYYNMIKKFICQEKITPPSYPIAAPIIQRRSTYLEHQNELVGRRFQGLRDVPAVSLDKP